MTSTLGKKIMTSLNTSELLEYLCNLMNQELKQEAEQVTISEMIPGDVVIFSEKPKEIIETKGSKPITLDNGTVVQRRYIFISKQTSTNIKKRIRMVMYFLSDLPCLEYFVHYPIGDAALIPAYKKSKKTNEVLQTVTVIGLNSPIVTLPEQVLIRFIDLGQFVYLYQKQQQPYSNSNTKGDLVDLKVISISISDEKSIPQQLTIYFKELNKTCTYIARCKYLNK